jgi:hypothetical protein
LTRSTGIAIGAVAVAIGLILLIPAMSNLTEETSTETFQGVTDLVFDLENSSLNIIGGATDAVVETSVTAGLLGGEVVIEQSDGTLHLEQRCPLILGWGCRAFFSVTLPSDVEVSGSTSNGAVTAESLDEPISVTTSNGAINVVDISGLAVLRTSNGAILAQGLTSSEVDASTSNGRVQLEFAAAPGSVHATSSNGEIVVILPEDAPDYAVGTSTSNGRVVTEVRTDPAAPASIDIETSNGDITVRYAD